LQAQFFGTALGVAAQRRVKLLFYAGGFTKRA